MFNEYYNLEFSNGLDYLIVIANNVTQNIFYQQSTSITTA